VPVDRLFFVLGSISGFLAVAVGAFGAHLLRDRIPPELMHTFKESPKRRERGETRRGARGRSAKPPRPDVSRGPLEGRVVGGRGRG